MKLNLKSPRFVPFGANLTKFERQIRPLYWTYLPSSLFTSRQGWQGKPVPAARLPLPLFSGQQIGAFPRPGPCRQNDSAPEPHHLPLSADRWGVSPQFAVWNTKLRSRERRKEDRRSDTKRNMARMWNIGCHIYTSHVRGVRDVLKMGQIGTKLGLIWEFLFVISF